MERSNPLHNFNLPPTWGKHKLLGCRHVYENESDGSDEFNENPLPKNRDKRLEKQSSEDPRRNLRLKLNASSGKDVSVSDDDVSDGEDEMSVAREKLMGEYKSAIGNKMKETNMKKGATAIGECGGTRVGVAEMEIDDPQSDKKAMRPRRNQDKKEERPKFSLSLSRKEIEDDFFAMTGKKPPRRPKRRSRAVQAQINGLFPGSMLTEPCEDRYKV